ncbi:MAG: TRL-like family protein [Crocinitomicaceae bacterium]|jgi:hypothetical protein|nr:TRL-like family protein [Crocinitomicaceae bacterium]
MRKIKNIFALAVAGIALASCTTAYPGIATGAKGTKTGVAERTIWLGITFGRTDLGAGTAAKNGGITKVATIDFEVVTGKPFRVIYRTTVTGE